MPLAEFAQRRAGLGIQHPAPANDQRSARRTQHLQRPRQLLARRRRAPQAPRSLLEQARRPTQRLGLHVLTQRERHRAAARRVRQHLHRAIEGDHQLLRSRDAIEVARQRPQAIVRRDESVAEILELLQHRIGPTGRKHVSRQQQHGQPIDVGDGRSRRQIRGSWPYGGRTRHHAAAVRSLGKGDCRMAHRLLIMGSQCGKDVARGVQRFAECRHVAMPEYGPDAGEHPAALAINFGPLRRHGAHQGLRHGEPTCRQFALLSGRSYARRRTHARSDSPPPPPVSE